MSFADRIDVQQILAAGVVARAEWHESLPSTQDLAAERAASGPLPLAVIADRQTAGRGRGTNRWWTGAGSLALSLAFDPAAWGLSPQASPVRSLAAAVALVDLLAPRLPGLTVGLHWPNDVFVQRRKIAGILLDVLPGGQHVLGLGLNVNNSLAAAPEELRDSATTLRDLTGRLHDRTQLLLELAEQLARAFRQLAAEPERFGRRLDSLCLQIGRPLTVDQSGQRSSGRCAGIAPDGALLLDTYAGRRAFYSGVLVK